MKKIFCVLSIVVAVVQASGATSESLDNSNNSFETINDKGVPVQWVINEVFKARGTLDIVTENVQDGKNCLLIKNGSGQVFHLFASKVWRVMGGDVIKLSAYVKGKGKFKLGVYVYKDGGGYPTIYPPSVEVAGGDWERKEFVITIPDGLNGVMRSVIVVDGNSEVYLDNFQGEIIHANPTP